MKRWLIRLSVLLVLLPLTAGYTPPDHGGERREVRTLPAFTEVAVHSALDADIAIGAGFHVEVSGDPDLVPRVHTAVQGRRLTVDILDSPPYGLRYNLLVQITVPALSFLEASGAAQVSVRGSAVKVLRVAVSGASRINFAPLVRPGHFSSLPSTIER